MAGVALQSRFAGLVVEGDDSSDSENQTTKKTKNSNNVIKTIVTKKTKKQHGNVLQISSKKKKPKNVQATAQQWEQWKLREEQISTGSFDDELQKALMLSKLDYDKNKNANGNDEKGAKKKSKTNKNKKKNVMSLEQFNSMINGEDLSAQKDEESPDECTQYTEFKELEKLKREMKMKSLNKSAHERVRLRQPASDKMFTRVHYDEALESKNKKIEELNNEIEFLKGQVDSTKNRNKKLCLLIGQGEMRDKAEVMVEVERLRTVQEELTTELSTLHTDLERERSRYTDPKIKDKKYYCKKKQSASAVDADL